MRAFSSEAIDGRFRRKIKIATRLLKAARTVLSVRMVAQLLTSRKINGSVK